MSSSPRGTHPETCPGTRDGGLAAPVGIAYGAVFRADHRTQHDRSQADRQRRLEDPLRRRASAAGLTVDDTERTVAARPARRLYH